MDYGNRWASGQGALKKNRAPENWRGQDSLCRVWGEREHQEGISTVRKRTFKETLSASMFPLVE